MINLIKKHESCKMHEKLLRGFSQNPMRIRKTNCSLCNKIIVKLHNDIIGYKVQVSLLLEYSTKFDDRFQNMKNDNDILLQQLDDKDKFIQTLCNLNQILIYKL